MAVEILRVGNTDVRVTFKELVMDLFDLVGLACAAGLFAYMLYALFKPERFLAVIWEIQ